MKPRINTNSSSITRPALVERDVHLNHSFVHPLTARCVHGIRRLLSLLVYDCDTQSLHVQQLAYRLA